MGTNWLHPFSVIFIYAQKGLLSNKTGEASPSDSFLDNDGQLSTRLWLKTQLQL
jgi:hypothetical protein